MKYINYNYIMDHLSIEELALENGFNYVKEKNSKKWPVLQNEEGLRIIVGRGDTGIDYYFNSGDDNEKGTIITFLNNYPEMMDGKEMPTFLEERLGKDIYNRNYQLGEDLQTPDLEKYGSKYINNNISAQRSTFNIEEHSFTLLSQNNNHKSPAIKYLTEIRQIPEETVFAPQFIDSIGVTEYKNNQRSFKNITFPMYQIDIKNGEIKKTGLLKMGSKLNKETGELENFKYFALGSNKSQSVWISELKKEAFNQSRVPLIITESPIDALSLYSLYPEKLDNAMFISTMGQVTKQQIEQIKNINYNLNHNTQRSLDDHTNIIVAMDNDLQGNLFNLQLKCRLGNIQCLESLPTSYKKLQHIEFKFTDNRKSIHLTLRLCTKYDASQRQSIKEQVLSNIEVSSMAHSIVAEKRGGSHPRWDGVFFQSEPEHEKIEIQIPTTDHNLKQLDKNLAELTGIKTARSKTKDWNEDLLRSLVEKKAKVNEVPISIEY